VTGSASGGWLLAALVVVPLLTSVALLVARLRSARFGALVGTASAGVTLSLAVVATAWAAPFDRAGPGLELDVSWIGALGVRLHLGLDGISAPLVLLTSLLTLLVCAHLVRVQPVAGRVPALVACVLAVESGALGTFLALDLIVFFVAFETVLVPMWFVIARWGDDGQPARTLPPAAPRPGGEAARRDAANRFVLFTVTGSAVMLLGLLLVALRAGTTDLVLLAEGGGDGMSTAIQTIAAGLLVLGLAVKAPMFPLHTWLPPAHTIAPTGGSVLLAGVLLKMGTYGLVRVVVPVVPDGLRAIAPLLGAFGVAGILWGGLACFVERDLKRLIALSSVAHMGFVLLGVASMTPEGLQGALFANVAHGLITGLLFLVVGAVKDRHHTAELARLMPGLRDRLPRLGWLLAFGALAGLGLPGLAGFWGELLAIAGAWRPDSALGVLSRPLAVLAAIGTAIAAAYLLRVLRELWHGAAPGASPVAGRPTADEEAIPAGPFVGDATTHEVAVTAPLVVATLALGIVPALLLEVTGPTVRVLLGGTP
jgi:NADH-quinone oxidoreductase subunit M